MMQCINLSGRTLSKSIAHELTSPPDTPTLFTYDFWGGKVSQKRRLKKGDGEGGSDTTFSEINVPTVSRPHCVATAEGSEASAATGNSLQQQPPQHR